MRSSFNLFTKLLESFFVVLLQPDSMSYSRNQAARAEDALLPISATPTVVGRLWQLLVGGFQLFLCSQVLRCYECVEAAQSKHKY